MGQIENKRTITLSPKYSIGQTVFSVRGKSISKKIIDAYKPEIRGNSLDDITIRHKYYVKSSDGLTHYGSWQYEESLCGDTNAVMQKMSQQIEKEYGKDVIEYIKNH